MDWGRKWLVDVSAGKTQLISFDWSNNTSFIDVKVDGSALAEKSSFKMLELPLSSKLNWGSYILSTAKTASKKMGVLICSVKFLFLQRLLFISINLPFGRAWNIGVIIASSCYLEILDKVYIRAVGTSLAVCLEPLSHLQHVARLSMGITLLDIHLNWLNCFHSLILVVSLLVILIDCRIFLSPYLDVRRMSILIASFFAHLNSLPIKCFPLTFNLNGLKCRINRHLICRFFLGSFHVVYF